MFLEVWQAKELQAHFSDVWQRIGLAETRLASRFARNKDVWQGKHLEEDKIRNGVTCCLGGERSVRLWEERIGRIYPDNG